MAEHHSFRKPPTEDELELHVDAFVTTLATGDLEAAFELCPGLLPDGTLLDASDEAAVRAFVTRAVVPGIDGASDDLAEWCPRITPPSAVEFEDVDLEAPERGEEGEVRANLHVSGKVRAVGRYDLRKRDGAWVLAFVGFARTS